MVAYTARSVFYYPYASLGMDQSPILRAVALYFDKLFLLHPDEATAQRIGTSDEVRRDIAALIGDRRLRLLNPLDLLARHGDAIEQGITNDMIDPEWQRSCHEGTSAREWRLALAKVPPRFRERHVRSREEDQIARRFMQTQAARCGFRTVFNYDETEYFLYDREKSLAASTAVPVVSVYDEDRRKETGLEYRYADYPMPLGESIMLNHAIAGMLDKRAVPITDDPFHERMFRHKVARLLLQPAFRNELGRLLPEDLAAETEASLRIVTDTKLGLPMLRLPVEVILEFRHQHGTELNAARDSLGWLAREIASAPMTMEFAAEVRHTLVPEVNKRLDEARKARDSWLSNERTLNTLKAVGIATAAVAVVAEFALGLAPITQGQLAKAALGLGSGSIIPMLALALESRTASGKTKEQALRYLLTEK